MATTLSTGWSASRLAPRSGLPGTPLGSSATPQQNPFFSQLAQVLGIKPPTVSPLIRSGTVGTPSERVADKIANAAEIAQVAARSAPGIFSQSGNIVLPNSAYRATPTQTPLQAGLAKAIGIPTAAVSSPTISGTAIATSPNTEGGTLGSGLAPGQGPYVSPLASITTPQATIVNTTIPGVTNFNTLANQNQNLPSWLTNAIQNLNNPDNYNPPAPVGPVGGGFDPRIGATMAATEARIAAQQKALDTENKARIARVKAEAAASEHAHELQIQRQRLGGGGINYQSGWGAF